MNQISQLIQQLRQMFAGMPPQSRLMAILLLLGICVSAAFLVQGATGGGGATAYLFDGRVLSQEELDRIEFAFGSAKLGNYDRVGNRIRVPKSSRSEYYKAISDAKAIPEGMGGAVDAALSNNSFLESTKTTEAKFLAGRLKDVSNAIKEMNQLIQDAYVTYDEKREGFSAERKQTASVAIKTRGGRPLTSDQKRSIIAYVEKSFAGLKQSEIALLDLNDANTMIASDDPAILEQSKYYQLKRQREEEFRVRADRLLSDYGNVRIDVNVEIDPTVSEAMEQLNYNEKPTTIQSTQVKKDAKMMRNGSGGRPGTDPNATANKSVALSSSADQENTTKEQTDNEKRITGNTLTRSEKVGLQTTRVTFSVAVPFSYYRKAALHRWQEMNPGKPTSESPEFKDADLKGIIEETQTSIQAKLSPILPKAAAGEDQFPRVTVSYYYDMSVPEIQSPTFTQTAMGWMMQSWQTLALIGLVGVAMMSLRSFARSAPASSKDTEFENGFDLPLGDASDIDLASLTDDDTDMGGETQEKDEIRAPKLRTTGGDVKNDLTTLVRENPDAAATLLRNWIGEGA